MYQSWCTHISLLIPLVNGCYDGHGMSDVQNNPATPTTDDSMSSLAVPFVQKMQQTPSASPISVGVSKESPPTFEQNVGLEMVGADAAELEPIPPEVASWMQKVSRDNSQSSLQEVVVTGQSSTPPKNGFAAPPVFVLPLGQAVYSKGLQESVDTSIRWLSEWCRKMVKKFGAKVAFG